MFPYFGGYAVSITTLEQLAARTGKVVAFTQGLDPYVDEIKRLVNQPANTLGVGFDALFRDVQPVALPKRSPAAERPPDDGEGLDGEEWEDGVVLVRVEGDPLKYPEYFRETAGDKRVKKVVEECIGLEIGPFMTYIYQC